MENQFFVFEPDASKTASMMEIESAILKLFK